MHVRHLFLLHRCKDEEQPKHPHSSPVGRCSAVKVPLLVVCPKRALPSQRQAAEDWAPAHAAGSVCESGAQSVK